MLISNIDAILLLLLRLIAYEKQMFMIVTLASNCFANQHPVLFCTARIILILFIPFIVCLYKLNTNIFAFQ